MAYSPDLLGKKFNRLTALERIAGSRRVPVKWICECECGTIFTIRQSEMVSGRTKSCGCFRLDRLREIIPYNFVDMSGQRFERLLVISRAENKTGNTMWLCQCDCGQTKIVDRGNLISGRQKSCGCHSRELAAAAHTSHGLSKTKLYKIWSWMITRCYNPNATHYKHYGGRGIGVCDEWRNDFMAFKEDMGATYSKGLEIDRIEVDGHYCKDNCRWATQRENALNKRNSVFLTANGVTKPLVLWAEELGVKRHRLYKRLRRGLTHEQVLFGE